MGFKPSILVCESPGCCAAAIHSNHFPATPVQFIGALFHLVKETWCRHKRQFWWESRKNWTFVYVNCVKFIFCENLSFFFCTCFQFSFFHISHWWNDPLSHLHSFKFHEETDYKLKHSLIWWKLPVFTIWHASQSIIYSVLNIRLPINKSLPH